MAYLDEVQQARDVIAAQAEGLDLSPFDNLTQSFGTAEEGFRIQMAEKDSMIQELTAEISVLKAKNYDLMMAVAPPPEIPTDGDGDGEVDADGDGEEDDSPKGISALMGEDEN